MTTFSAAVAKIRESVAAQIPTEISARVIDSDLVEILINTENATADRHNSLLRLISANQLTNFSRLLPDNGKTFTAVADNGLAIVLESLSESSPAVRNAIGKDVGQRQTAYRIHAVQDHSVISTVDIPADLHRIIHLKSSWISPPRIFNNRILCYLCEPYYNETDEQYSFDRVDNFGESSSEVNRPVACAYDLITGHFIILPGLPDEYGAIQVIIASMSEESDGPTEGVLNMDCWLVVVPCRTGERLGMCYYTSRPSRILNLKVKWDTKQNTATCKYFIDPSNPAATSNPTAPWMSPDRVLVDGKSYRSFRWLFRVDNGLFCFSNKECGEHWGPMAMFQITESCESPNYFNLNLKATGLWIRNGGPYLDDQRLVWRSSLTQSNQDLDQGQFILPLIKEGVPGHQIYRLDSEGTLIQIGDWQPTLPLDFSYGECVQLLPDSVPPRVKFKGQVYDLINRTTLCSPALDEIYQVDHLNYVVRLRPKYLRPPSELTSSRRIRVCLFLHGGPNSVVLAAAAALPAVCYFLMEALELDSLICPNYPGSIGYSEHHWKSLAGHIGEMDVKFCRDALASELLRLSQPELFNKPTEQLNALLDKQYSKDQDLISAITAKLNRFPSVVIYGGSHGGFLGAHLIGQNPQLFSVAILNNPVIDISCPLTDIPDWAFYQCVGNIHNNGTSEISQSTSRALYDSESNRSEKWTGEHQINLRTKQWLCSPLQYVDRVRAATFIALGEKDLRVNPQHGRQLYRALKDLQNLRSDELKLYAYPNSNHSLSEPKIRAHRDNAMIRFTLGHFINKETTYCLDK